ncbi:proline-, glutamic acid- and leucine-rich protein 1-like [Scylla paramamosain]|uniref:proline-, glutamic acid- and leucine-rich protein 1-like n=1 Tax=Scylla paramamosain TaxID=85552 RepID=UPI00308308FD
MAGHTPLQGDRAAWCRERLEFFSAVINNLDRERLKVELENCETEEDAAGLMHSLLWLQDNMQTHYPGGAAAIDPPEPDEPLGREFEDDIPEEHHPLYVAVDDLPASQPVMFDPRDLNIPVDAGEPHTFLQDVVYLGNHEQQQQRQEEEDEEEEWEERVDFEDYEAPPAAMCEPEVLDAARPENHTHQPLHMEEDEEEEEEEQQHQQEKQQDDEDLPLLQPLPSAQDRASPARPRQ